LVPEALQQHLVEDAPAGLSTCIPLAGYALYCVTRDCCQTEASFAKQFDGYLAEHYPGVDLEHDILGQVRKHIVSTVSAAWPELRSKNNHGGFQLYGYDFIIDSDFRVWLLEVNGAPAAADRLRAAIARDIVALCIGIVSSCIGCCVLLLPCA